MAWQNEPRTDNIVVMTSSFAGDQTIITEDEDSL
jgi:hypothetical protein